MSGLCAACGSAKARSSVGGVPLCGTCSPKIHAEMDTLRASGKPVDVSKIALALFRGENSVGSYLLRDIPMELWRQAKHISVDRGISLRELLLDALRDYIAHGKNP